MAGIKEEWDLKKMGMDMQEEQSKNINASGEDVKKYIDSFPDDLVDKISIINGQIAYDINKFDEKEQLTLKSDYGFKAYGDTIAPYGSIEKKIKDGKVKITVFSADDESDVDEIILPNGVSKKIKYETENILLKGTLFESEGLSQKILNKYFKNVTVDSENKINTLAEVKNYNVILDLNGYGQPANYNFLNACFEDGKNLVTSGNDSTEALSIIKSSFFINYNTVYTQIVKNNEITKFCNTAPGIDSLTCIKFRDNADVWSTAKIAGQEMDVLCEYENEKGTRWIHRHLGDLDNVGLFYRNSIYRVTGSRSATYEVDKNGTYTFIIKDLAGNQTEISIDVTEL